MLTMKAEYGMALAFIGGNIALIASVVSGKESSVILFKTLGPFGMAIGLVGLAVAAWFGPKNAGSSMARAYRRLTIVVTAVALLGPWAIILVFFGAGPNDPPATWIIMDSVLTASAICGALGCLLCAYALTRPSR